ncbi:MAG: glutaredoxin [Thermodesulfobacteriota bacterium]
MEGTVNITVYKWAGAFGPFKIKIPCGECALTRDVIGDAMGKELAGVPIELQIHDWLSEWWRPLIKGGYHAPIVMVDGSVIAQGVALNRGVLIEAVIRSYSKKTKVKGNHLFGKEGCPYCKRAKEDLAKLAIDYTYHNVIESPRAMYEMLERVKPLISSKTPVTVPQIWLGGTYIGGSDSLAEKIKQGELPK